MALAYTYDETLWENPWPRPRLVLVTSPEDPDDEPGGPGPTPVAASALPCENPELLEESEWSLLDVRQGADVTSRRLRRARHQVRRRRVAVATLLVVLLVALALPLSELGAKPATTVPAFASVDGAKVTYVVQPGDDVQTIAERFSSGRSASVVARELEAELGTTAVVPGEHIAVP